MIVVLQAVGEMASDVEAIIGDALTRAGHTWVSASDTDDLEDDFDVVASYGLSPAGTRSYRFGGREFELIADWSWQREAPGEFIFSARVPLDDAGTNQSRGFVDRVGADELANLASSLATSIDRAVAAADSTRVRLTRDELLFETELLQQDLRRSIAEGGDLRRELEHAQGTNRFLDLEIDRLESILESLNDDRNVAVATAKGGYVSGKLRFLAEVIVLAATSYTASLGATALHPAPSDPGSPSVTEYVERCYELSEQWRLVPLDGEVARGPGRHGD